MTAKSYVTKVINKYFQIFVRNSYKKSIRRFSMDTEITWRGVPISEIIGSQSPWGAPEFPLVTPSSSHAVLYHIPSDGLPMDRPPRPQVAEDKWDGEHVRMPCSSKSLYPVENEQGETRLRKRWEMIAEALQRPIHSSQELAEAILSYNTKFITSWRFTALHVLFNEHLDEEESRQFFIVTLPQIAKLALDLPNLIRAPIPLLKQNQNRSLSLSQMQAASLLANAFFCTFPRRNTLKRASEYASYPHINFSALYEQPGGDDILEKLKCICHYFRRVTAQAPHGVLTLSRRSVSASECPRWGRAQSPVGAMPLHVDSQGRIEDAHGLIQVDFANKYLGGGVLGRGSVQEEIRFVICPELMVSMLVTEVLRPKEALLIIGCERYSSYGGYSRSFTWRGDYIDASPRDSSGRRRAAVLAIDALPYRSAAQQLRPPCLIRELNKAWVGMSFYTDPSSALNYPGTATGNWGCGAFGGTPQLKSLIQVMACAQAGRPMAYYTFNDDVLRDEIISVYNLLVRHNVTIGQLYHYIMRFAAADLPYTHLHAFLHQAVVDDSNTTKRTMDNTYTNDPNETHQESNEELDPFQKELMNHSPDMFSQEDTESQTQSNNPTEVLSKGDEIRGSDPKRTSDTHRERTSDIHRETKWKWDSRKSIERSEKMNRDSHIQSDLNLYVHRTSENKMAANENKMASSNQTSRLFEEMEKFDQDNGKLNLNSSHFNSILSYRRISNELNHSLDLSTNSIEMDSAPNENKMSFSDATEKQIERNENKMSSEEMAVENQIERNENKISVSDEMVVEKLSENDDVSLDEILVEIASTSNIESTQKSRDLFASDSTETSSESQNKSQNHDTETRETKDIEKMDVSSSSEEKRKKARKITDYFTKKST